jgi:hypothetical protein
MCIHEMPDPVISNPKADNFVSKPGTQHHNNQLPHTVSQVNEPFI